MIKAQDIEDAQASWGSAVIAVGAASSQDDAHTRAVALVETHYLVEKDNLLFCPTKASEQQFRKTRQETVSYFVGHGLPEDSGFALEPWIAVRFDNAGIVCQGEVGIAMGNYFFSRADGSELKAEYSFVYVRDSAGQIKIQLHHSALPYQG